MSKRVPEVGGGSSGVNLPRGQKTGNGFPSEEGVGSDGGQEEKEQCVTSQAWSLLNEAFSRHIFEKEWLYVNTLQAHKDLSKEKQEPLLPELKAD